MDEFNVKNEESGIKMAQFWRWRKEKNLFVPKRVDSAYQWMKQRDEQSWDQLPPENRKRALYADINPRGRKKLKTRLGDVYQDSVKEAKEAIEERRRLGESATMDEAGFTFQNILKEKMQQPGTPKFAKLSNPKFCDKWAHLQMQENGVQIKGVGKYRETGKRVDADDPEYTEWFDDIREHMFVKPAEGWEQLVHPALIFNNDESPLEWWRRSGKTVATDYVVRFLWSLSKFLMVFFLNGLSKLSFKVVFQSCLSHHCLRRASTTSRAGARRSTPSSRTWRMAGRT